MAFLNIDVILDEEAFDQASAEFTKLLEDMNALRSDIDTMLNDLETGFNTTAGRKFISSCKDNLITPMEQQAATLEFSATTLKKARQEYEPVFDGYKALNSEIEQRQRH